MDAFRTMLLGSTGDKLSLPDRIPAWLCQEDKLSLVPDQIAAWLLQKCHNTIQVNQAFLKTFHTISVF